MHSLSTSSIFEIAPGIKNDACLARLEKLEAGADAATWKVALKDFYLGRLESRYMVAIEAIRDLKRNKGEGFAIVAIQCSLIEFLEGCYQGINYQHANPVSPYEYNKSAKVFVSFLTKRKHFKEKFTTKALAKTFYTSVRCGILHEARTKDGWRVWTSSGTGRIIDPVRKILYRDDFQDAVKAFIKDYCAEVEQDADRQAAFIRKYKVLCG